jgi:hypothetical protein
MVAPQLREKLCSVTRADVNVEKNYVDTALSELRARVVERSRFPDRAALELEVHTAEQADRRVVVDDENGVARALHGARQCTP